MIFEALEKCGVTYDRIDDRELVFDLGGRRWDYDAVLIRCISQSRALYAAKILNDWGVRTVNPYEVIATCGDKLLTTSTLTKKGIPCPKTAPPPAAPWRRGPTGNLRNVCW